MFDLLPFSRTVVAASDPDDHDEDDEEEEDNEEDEEEEDEEEEDDDGGETWYVRLPISSADHLMLPLDFPRGTSYTCRVFSSSALVFAARGRERRAFSFFSWVAS